ncbi:hypothetical protein ABZ912_26820 [Nonomuraea angiospora]|uniref:hypothetical protein n=1 Tax=Nonomuraea angiospora TaxID=46172 RepID=UPI0033CBFB1C
MTEPHVHPHHHHDDAACPEDATHGADDCADVDVHAAERGQGPDCGPGHCHGEHDAASH